MTVPIYSELARAMLDDLGKLHHITRSSVQPRLLKLELDSRNLSRHFKKSPWVFE